MNLDAFYDNKSDLSKELRERFPLFEFEIIRSQNYTYMNRARTLDPIKMTFQISIVTPYGKLPLEKQPNRQTTLANANKSELKVYQLLGFPDLWKIRKEVERILTKDKTQLNDEKCIFIEFEGLTYVAKRYANGCYRTEEII